MYPNACRKKKAATSQNAAVALQIRCFMVTYHGDAPGEREVLCGPLEDVPAREDRHEDIAYPGVHWASLRPVE